MHHFDLMRALKLDLQHYQAMVWILLGALNNLGHLCSKSLPSLVQCFQTMLVMTEYCFVPRLLTQLFIQLLLS